MQNEPGVPQYDAQYPPQPAPMSQPAPRKRWPWVVGIGCVLILCACAVAGALGGGVLGGLFGGLIGGAIQTGKQMQAVASQDYPDFTYVGSAMLTENGVERAAVRLHSSKSPEFYLQPTYVKTSSSGETSPTWSAEDDFFRAGAKNHDISEGFITAFVRDNGRSNLVVLGVSEQPAGTLSNGDRAFKADTVDSSEDTSVTYDSSKIRTFTYAYRPARQDWVQVVR